MSIKRILKHLVATQRMVKRMFPHPVLNAIEHAIAASETQHFPANRTFGNELPNQVAVL